jgi:hypothetical protein
MLSTSHTARLTGREAERWTKITGFDPRAVRSAEDLLEYAARCKKHFWGHSQETRLLHFLIDEELNQCLATLPAIERRRAA